MKSFLGEGVACMDLGKNVVNLSIGSRTYWMCMVRVYTVY